MELQQSIEDGGSAAPQAPFPPTPSPAPAEKGEKGEGGGLPALHVTNAEFMRAVFAALPEGAVPAICSIAGDPQGGGWVAEPARNVDAQCPAGRNNYFNCSSFMPDADGAIAAKNENFAAYHALVLDDVGTKVNAERLTGVEPSWTLETSEGNSQIGFILAEPLRDVQQVDRLQSAVVAAELCDPGAKGKARWMRLSNAINGKPKHSVAGFPFRCRLKQWSPSRTFTIEELADALGLDLSPVSPVLRVARREAGTQLIVAGDDVYTPPTAENPVLSRLREKGLYKRQLAPRKHDVTCPWRVDHTDGLDDGAAYFEPSSNYPMGGFRCHHSHGEAYHIGNLIDFLGVSPGEARNRPRIRIVAGELNRIAQAAETGLASKGEYFDAEGTIVTIHMDQSSSDLRIEQVSEQALTRALAEVIEWEFCHPTKGWVRCDPHVRTVNMMHRGQAYQLLPKLLGLARQPFFREDGALVTSAGHDAQSGKFAWFDANKFVLGPPTLEGAQAALARLIGLLSEFHFADEADRSAALSAMLTAAVRPSLPVAPAFNLTAARPGSGKTYLGSIISKFAGPGEPHSVSYPKTSEEATKEMLALLLQGPAVINFDDMDSDWKPHGAINRMLTSSTITDRLLGLNRTATVSTRVLVLGSGNNVEPIRDLRRRVISIRLSPRTATPALLKYEGRPAEEIKRHRESYVSDALTIIEAWRASGSPRTDVFEIASFNGLWSDYCRQPLLWLGLADPATSLQEQIQSDPDNEALGELLEAWFSRFGDQGITVRKLVGDLDQVKNTGLREALEDLPIAEGSTINRNKLGWFLRTQSRRVVRGLMVEPAPLKERNGWRVVRVGDELTEG
jgi:hypothetical protein